MAGQCGNPDYPQYEDYGGRGIENRFHTRDYFIRWSKKNLPHPTYVGVQIDRIDNDGHYEPGNLRLVTQRENLSNKRTSVKVEYHGLSVNVHHLWHLLKADHPDFNLSQNTTAKLAKIVHWTDILRRKPRGLYTAYKVEEVDPEVLAMYPGRDRKAMDIAHA